MGGEPGVEPEDDMEETDDDADRLGRAIRPAGQEIVCVTRREEERMGEREGVAVAWSVAKAPRLCTPSQAAVSAAAGSRRPAPARASPATREKYKMPLPSAQRLNPRHRRPNRHDLPTPSFRPLAASSSSSFLATHPPFQSDPNRSPFVCANLIVSHGPSLTALLSASQTCCEPADLTSSTSALQIRRQARERREYIYKKAHEAQERAIYDRKQAMKDALASGKPLPTELRTEARTAGRDLKYDEAQTGACSDALKLREEVQRTWLDQDDCGVVWRPRVGQGCLRTPNHAAPAAELVLRTTGRCRGRAQGEKC